LNEIRILASVESDFVISYKEAFLDEDSSTLCLVLELCETGDMLKILQDNQKKNKPESEESLWKCITQLALGLKALHSNNILHRDLKCANVFVSKEGIYKLGDMNVSKVSKHGLVTTQTGTPYYASPEVWQDKPYGAKSDIWSLGCVIYEMATFKPPFRAQDMKGLYKKVVAGKYDSIGSKYSSALQNMIGRLLQVDPSKRPTAEEILNDPII
jgi:NIMA (never in mitosis gene a)-related kinase